MEETEEWKQYKDTRYYVSTEGRVARRYSSFFILKKVYYNHRASIVTKINGKAIPVGRMVWETFRGDIPEGMRIIRKDGSKSNNDLWNLECVTRSESSRKTRSKGRKVLNLDTGEVYKNSDEAAKKLYVHKRTIYNLCAGKSNRLGYRLEWMK